MPVNKTSLAAIQRMENGIVQWNKALDHNMEPDIKFDCEQIAKVMRDCRKRAIEKNEKLEAIKNVQ